MVHRGFKARALALWLLCGGVACTSMAWAAPPDLTPTVSQLQEMERQSPQAAQLYCEARALEPQDKGAALAALTRATALLPDQPHLLLHRCRLELSHRQPLQARRTCARLVELRGAAIDHVALGLAYLGSDFDTGMRADTDRAEWHAMRAVWLDPRSPRGYDLLCRVGLFEQDWVLLKETVRTMEALFPEEARTHTHRAYLELQQRDPGAAQAALDRAHARGLSENGGQLIQVQINRLRPAWWAGAMLLRDLLLGGLAFWSGMLLLGALLRLLLRLSRRGESPEQAPGAGVALRALSLATLWLLALSYPLSLGLASLWLGGLVAMLLFFGLGVQAELAEMMLVVLATYLLCSLGIWRAETVREPLSGRALPLEELPRLRALLERAAAAAGVAAPPRAWLAPGDPLWLHEEGGMLALLQDLGKQRLILGEELFQRLDTGSLEVEVARALRRARGARLLGSGGGGLARAILWRLERLRRARRIWWPARLFAWSYAWLAAEALALHERLVERLPLALEEPSAQPEAAAGLLRREDTISLGG